MERMTTPEDVRNCYRLLLGRSPESAEALMNMADKGLTQKELVLTFLKSDECRRRFGNVIEVTGDAADGQ